jgi:DNA-binding CsgD family transcriptional regulator
MFVVDEKNGTQIIPTKEAVLFSETETKILTALARKPAYPKELAKQLSMHEQNLYYYIRNMEKKGLIRVIKKEEHGAALAKYYALSKPSFFVKFSDFRSVEKIPQTSKWLEPFIIDGRLNARIVIGSPDPHGPEGARSRDVNYAMEFALFLGTFLDKLKKASIQLDTEISSMKDDLIVIGGPVTNRITKKINDKLPVRFDKRKNIYSSISRKIYRGDECGIIVKTRNPYNKEKSIMVIAGKRYSGTRAAILAFLQNFEEITKKDTHVIQGIDDDGDGIIDTVKILE